MTQGQTQNQFTMRKFLIYFVVVPGALLAVSAASIFLVGLAVLVRVLIS